MWARVLRSLEIRKSCVVACVPPAKVTTTKSYPGMSLALGSASVRLTCGGTLYRDRISDWILCATSGGIALEDVAFWALQPPLSRSKNKNTFRKMPLIRAKRDHLYQEKCRLKLSHEGLFRCSG